MDVHCQAEIDARNQALRAYLRACLLRDYAMKRLQETNKTSAGDYWAVKFEERAIDAGRLEAKLKKPQEALENCLRKWGESAFGPKPEPPPQNDQEFDECLKKAPDFTGDWL